MRATSGVLLGVAPGTAPRRRTGNKMYMGTAIIMDDDRGGGQSRPPRKGGRHVETGSFHRLASRVAPLGVAPPRPVTRVRRVGARAIGEQAQLDPRLSQQCQHLIEVLSRWTPGPLAELNRLVPGRPSGTTFWRAMLAVLPETEGLPEAPERRRTFEQRWGAIIRLAAVSVGLPTEPLGIALARSNLSPVGLKHLLDAQGLGLEMALRQVAAHLANQGRSASLYDCACLLMSDDTDIRQRITREYHFQVGRPPEP